MPEQYLKKKDNLKSKILDLDAIIIHIHGGGFIATQSSTHQNYLRIYANSIPNSVIFSIDYRLAPQHRFPSQIDDCWQAYTWIVLYAE